MNDSHETDNFWALGGFGLLGSQLDQGGIFVAVIVVGCLVGGMVGVSSGGHLRAFFWAIGVDESPITFSSDVIPVRFPSETMTSENLTPSDLVFLEMVPRDKRKIPRSNGRPVKEPPAERIEQVLAMAILANEEAGAIRLEMVKEKVGKKGFFGASNSMTNPEFLPSFLVADRLSHAPQWPIGSLESELCKSGVVSYIISTWIKKPSVDPQSRAVKRIMTSMADRRLLEVDKRRVLNFFTMTSRPYVLPERVSSLATQQSVRLLEERLRPNPQLTSAIKKGFDRRTMTEEAGA